MLSKRLQRTGRFAGLLLLIEFLLIGAHGVDRVELVNGETYRGQLSGMTAGYVILSQTSDRGFIERRYSPEQIKKIHFSDTAIRDEATQLFESGQYDQATILFEGLVWKRLPYLGILESSEEQLVADLIQCYLETGRSTEASERIRLWTPRLTDVSIVESLEESAILAAWNSGNRPASLLLAQQWIEQGKPASTTCLAWRILAHENWLEGLFDECYWASLQPIAFSQLKPSRHIEYCYALAILSATRLGHENHATHLATEMEERELTWPIELPTRSELVALKPNRKMQPPRNDESTSNTIHMERLTKLLGKP